MLLAGAYLWIGAVVRADDHPAQLLTHLPGQQAVSGSFPRAPRASVDEDHQGRRPLVEPAHVRGGVQVQLLAPAAKRYALGSVHTSRLLAFTPTVFHADIGEADRNRFLNPSTLEANFITPFRSAFGFRRSRTRTSTGSKVSHTGDIRGFPAPLWSYKISV